MEWMVISGEKLEHHCVIGKMHLVANGEAHYGHWLMTSEELAVEKKWQDDWDNVEEWNKFAFYGVQRREEAYERGKVDEVYNIDYGKGLYPTHKLLAECCQLHYDAGFNHVDREKVDSPKSIVFRCPWYTEELCNHYRNHSWVAFSEVMSEKPLTWRRAMKERGSEEKLLEFVKWYNQEKGQIE